MQTVSSSDIFANVGRTGEEKLYCRFSNSTTFLDTSYKVLKLKLRHTRSVHNHFSRLSWNYGWNFLEDMVVAGEEELRHQNIYHFHCLQSLAFI